MHNVLYHYQHHPRWSITAYHRIIVSLSPHMSPLCLFYTSKPTPMIHTRHNYYYLHHQHHHPSNPTQLETPLQRSPSVKSFVIKREFKNWKSRDYAENNAPNRRRQPKHWSEPTKQGGNKRNRLT